MQHIVPMNQLIPIIEHDGKTAVNLRDLHAYLEVKRAFTHWANDMFEYGFTEGQDYVEVSLVRNDKQTRGGRNRLFEFMGELGWLYRHGKRRSWHAYQPQVENGRIVLKMSPAFQNAKTGELERPAPTIRLTAKGVEALRTKLLEAVAA